MPERQRLTVQSYRLSVGEKERSKEKREERRWAGDAQAVMTQELIEERDEDEDTRRDRECQSMSGLCFEQLPHYQL